MDRKPVNSLLENSCYALVQPKYRAEIDGLRALAVLSVVGYHAFPDAVPGGFIGVDVFFVISGFLISSILYENLETSTFTLRAFYFRRIRRIFPALLVVLAAALAAGWLWLLPDEFSQLGKHTFGGAAFFSNLMFLSESERYFDNAAETKPLLHLWSLGVEEQFYILWPLLLWWSWRRRWRWTSVLVPLLIGSFVLNFAIAHRHPAVDFYSPATRFWELLIGALLADPRLGLFLKKRQETYAKALVEIMPLLGVALIAAGLVIIERHRLYPFTWALLPTLGTALIIGSNPRAWFCRAVLASPVAVWLGLISYPFYLWHWPLLSFGTILGAGAPSAAVRAALVGVSIVFAWLTYRLFEKPLRFGARLRLKALGAAGAMVFVGAAGVVAFTAGGIPSRLKSQLAIDLVNYNYFGGKSEQEFWGTGSCFNFDEGIEFYRKNGCEQIEFPGHPTVFLTGDSYSAFLSPGLRQYLHSRKVNLFQYSVTDCFFFSMRDDRSRCRKINDHVLQMIRSVRPDTLIVFGQYRGTELNPHYLEKMPYTTYYLNMMRRLSTSGVGKIIFIGQYPNWDVALPKMLLRRFVRWGRPIPDRALEGVEDEPREIDRALRSQPYPANVTYVSLFDGLCNEAGCLVKVGDAVKDNLIVFDRGHMTTAGSIYVSNHILSKLLP